MNTVFALSGVVIKELARRKDFYVLFVLTAVITALMGIVNIFGDPKVFRYLKDMVLLLIWVSGLVIAVTTAARQLPAERENRTIFPLLAKPVTRGQVVVGKFVGCWLATGISLLVFYAFFCIISGAREQQWPILLWMKGAWLQWIMLGIIIGMALLGSVVFAAPSSNATILFVVVFGILLLGRHLNSVALQQPEPARTIVYSLYFLIPHLEWFYGAKDLILYDHDQLKGSACALATAYGAAYISFLLFATWMVFRRKPLSV